MYISGIKACNWLEEMSSLPSFMVPRCLMLSEEEVVLSALHVFIDASPTAYGATAYAKYIYQSASISRRIVAAKAREASLKVVSLPHLGMTGAVGGLRLASSISNVRILAKLSRILVRQYECTRQ